MHKNKQYLALAALSLALAAPALQAAPSSSSSSAKSAAAKPAAVVPTPFPADATAHMNALNGDAALPVLKDGAKGLPVVRAQILLDRAWFSPGEIDGYFSGNTLRAVRAFQLARKLPVTGIVDEATWSALASGQQAPVFATYTLTEQDVAGPYTAIPEDPELQANMPKLGYRDTLEALAERFHASPKLLAALNKGRPVVAGQQMVVTEAGRPQGLAGANSIRIDKSDRMLYVLDGGGQVLGAFPVSFGGEARNPLPEGLPLKIVNKVPNPDFSYNPALLKDPKTDQKLRLPPGPNNPVGVMWLGLSKEHWGIHGTPEPSQMARVETSGCVRLTNWDVERLGTLVNPGMPVEVQS